MTTRARRAPVLGVMAAIVAPPTRSGAEIERRPISSSWSTSAHPSARTVSTAARRRARSVIVRSVKASSSAPARNASSSSSGSPASRTRPIEVQCAGSREPTPSEMVMMRRVGMRAT